MISPFVNKSVLLMELVMGLIHLVMIFVVDQNLKFLPI